MPADKHILILDSHAASHKSLTDTLNRLSYAVGRIGSAAEAQSALAATPQAILIVAARATAAQSIAQLAELRALLPDARIIAIGVRTLDAALAAWHAGADDYLSQPVRDDALIAALDRVSKEHVAQGQSLHRLSANEQTLQDQLDEAAKIRAQTIELVHQINNPLTPILGMADLLLDELPANHPGREYAQAILTSAMRIRDVVRALADSMQPRD